MSHVSNNHWIRDGTPDSSFIALHGCLFVEEIIKGNSVHWIVHQRHVIDAINK